MLRDTPATNFSLTAFALEPRILFDGAAVATADAIVPTETQALDNNSGAIDVQTESVLTAFSYLDVNAGSSATDEAVTTSVDLFAMAQAESQVSILGDAKQQAEQRIVDFLQHAEANQLFKLFNGGQSSPDAAWGVRLNQLLTTINEGNFKLNIVDMDRASQYTAIAAYTRDGPNGEPTVFINRYWFDMFDIPDATRILVEEFGHAIDDYLNPDGDTIGDEGELFADRVFNGSVDAATLASVESDSDHGTVSVGGFSYEVEFASFSFGNAYEMVYDLDNNGAIDTNERWAAKEQNSHFFNTAALGTAIIDDSNYNNQYFSGNDVSAIGLSIGGTEYFGWISRPIKSGGIVRGFYFWTDDNFTNLATAQADGNQDGDSNIMDNSGFLLVVDQGWFTQQIATNTQYTINNAKDGNLGTVSVTNIGSSSDRVDSALNALVDANSAPLANADTANGANGTTAAIEAGYNVSTVNAAGNVLSNDTDTIGDSLVVTQVSTGTKSNTASVGNSTPGTINGQYGALTLQANGSYSYAVANGNPTVDALQNGQSLNDVFVYAISDGKGGTASATLTIVINGSNDAPAANPDYNTAKESITGYSGYSATGDVTVNDADVDDSETTKYIDGITVSGGATVGSVAVTTGAATLSFIGDNGFTSVGTNQKLYVNIGGTYRAVYASDGTTQVSVSSKNESPSGSNNWVITLSATPRYYYDAGGNVAITSVSSFFSTNSAVGFENSTSTTENTNGMKTAAVAVAASTGYTTLSNLGSLSGTIAVGMTVTSSANSGIPADTRISEITYTGGVLTSIKLDKELTSTVTGNFTFTASATVGNTIQGAHGTLVLNTNGSYTYTPTANNPNLSSGESAVEVFQYTMRDHIGGTTSSNTLYITVYGTGSNDPLPTNDNGAANEAGVAAGSTAGGNVLSDDKQTANAGTAGTNVIVIAAGLSGSGSTTAIGSGETKTINGLFGSLQLSSNGIYTYTANDALAAVNALAAGQSLTEVFNYQVANTTSPASQTWATLTVTINGANDAPTTVADTASAVEDSGAVPVGNVLGNDSDVDNGDSLSVANVIAGTDTNSFGAGNAVTVGSTSTSSARTVTGSYGTLYIGADGSYRYVLDNTKPAVQALTPASPAITDVFTYRAADAAGGYNTATLTISITGANETPVNQFNGTIISSTSSTSLTTPVNTALDFTASNLLTVADADNNLASIVLEVEHGTLSFTSAPSVVTLSAASGKTITISAGTQAELNAALALLRYTPDNNFYGTDFLTINSADSNSARDIDGIAINIPMAFTGPTVNESDLSTGSNANGSGEVGSTTLTAPAGQSFGSSAQSGSDAYGAWTLTTGGLFTYTLSSAPPVAGTASTRTINIITYDQVGNAITNTVTVTIADDMPTATVNTKSVNEGATATGNVLTDSTPDTFGADGAKLTSPVGGVIGFRTGSDTSTPATSNIGTEIIGTYGKLTLNANGSYTYIANSNSVTSAQNEVFVYTVEDADGDRSTATLTVTVNDVSTDTIAVTGYGPVNEGSTYAMFTAVASGSQTLDLAVTNGTTSLSSPVIEFSTDGTNWTVYDSSHKPTGGTVYVRVTLTSEADSSYEGSESFSLVATNSTNNAIMGNASSSIVDDGTGSKYGPDFVLVTGPNTDSTSLDDDRSPAESPAQLSPPNVSQIVDFNIPQPIVIVAQQVDVSSNANLDSGQPGNPPQPEESGVHYGLIDWPGIQLSGDRDHYHQVWGESRAEIMEVKIDLSLEAGRYLKLPPEALMALDTNDSLRFDAYLKNGDELPDWIHLNRNDGSLQVDQDARFGNENVVVKVVATDTKGNQVTVTAILKPKNSGAEQRQGKSAQQKAVPQKALQQPVGKAALTEQINQTGNLGLRRDAVAFLRQTSHLFNDSTSA